MYVLLGVLSVTLFSFCRLEYVLRVVVAVDFTRVQKTRADTQHSSGASLFFFSCLSFYDVVLNFF